MFYSLIPGLKARGKYVFLIFWNIMTGHRVSTLLCTAEPGNERFAFCILPFALLPFCPSALLSRDGALPLHAENEALPQT